MIYNVFVCLCLLAITALMYLSYSNSKLLEKKNVVLKESLRNAILKEPLRKAVYSLRFNPSQSGALKEAGIRYTHEEIVDIFNGKISFLFLVVWGKHIWEETDVSLDERFGFAVLCEDDYLKWVNGDLAFISKTMSDYETNGYLEIKKAICEKQSKEEK